METAKNLIAQKQYNAAMEILSLVIREEPEKQEKAMILINQIIDIRNQYNKKYEELIEVLYDERDVEKGLALIYKLQELDPNPNETVKKTVDLAKSGASFVANSTYFNDLMDEALYRINETKYSEAISRYIKGFNTGSSIDLYRRDYENANLGNILSSALKTNLETMLNFSNRIMDNITAIENTIKKVDTKIPIPLDAELPVLVDKLITAFLEGLDINKNMESESYLLEQRIDQLKTMGEEYQYVYFYFNYVSQLISGRVSKEHREGIMESILLINENYSQKLITTISKAADSYFEQGLAEYKSRTYDLSMDNMEKAYALYSLALPVAYFLDRKESLAGAVHLDQKGEWLVSGDLNSFVKVQENGKSAASYITLMSEIEELNQFTDLTNPPNDQQQEAVKIEVTRIMNEVKGVVDDWDTYKKLGSMVYGEEFNSSRADTIIQLSGYISAMFIEEYLRIMKLTYSVLVTKIEEEIVLFKEGVPEVVKEADGTILQFSLYFPETRMAFFSSTLKSMKSFSNRVTSVIDLWLEDESSESGSLASSSEELADIISSIKNFASEVDSRSLVLEDYIEQCRIAIRDAAKFKDEGELRYQQARSSFARKQYTEARSRISDAANAFDKSLNKKEDSDVRKLRNTELTRLSNQIDTEENKLVIQEVRRLLDQGKSLYSKGSYDEAEVALIQAQTRWSDTQTERNSEIEDWLNYVRTAKNIKTEREIPVTDPLYNAIIALYNQAKEYYLLGKNEVLIKGLTENAKSYFKVAKSKILEIMLVFPYNNDARVLDLLITKESDSKEFQQVYKSKLSEARNLLANKDQIEKRKGYNILVDLAQIVPDDRTVKTMIEEAEFLLGLKIRPPSQVSIRRSNALASEAKEIVDKKNRDLYSVARAKLDEALKENPSNALAIRLKDALLQDSVDVLVTSILDAAAKQLYDKALELYFKGLYIEARIYTNKLWNEPKNRRSNDVVELYEMVEAQFND